MARPRLFSAILFSRPSQPRAPRTSSRLRDVSFARSAMLFGPFLLRACQTIPALVPKIDSTVISFMDSQYVFQDIKMPHKRMHFDKPKSFFSLSRENKGLILAPAHEARPKLR